MIPKIIHQTWKDKHLPSLLQEIVDHNKRLLEDKGYEFRLWSDDEILELIKKEYPFLTKLFESAQLGVQKGDLGRLILIYHYGGIYIDLDILLLKDPVEVLDTSTNNLYITYEPSEQTAKLYNQNDYLCNAFFAANSNNNILNAAIKTLEIIYERNGLFILNQYNIFGASYIKGIIASNKHLANEVCIIEPRDKIYPICDLKFDDLPSSSTYWSMIKNAIYPENSVMVHYWIHGDFESKDLLEKYVYDKTLDIHQNAYRYFSTLYPNIANKYI